VIGNEADSKTVTLGWRANSPFQCS